MDTWIRCSGAFYGPVRRSGRALVVESEEDLNVLEEVELEGEVIRDVWLRVRCQGCAQTAQVPLSRLPRFVDVREPVGTCPACQGAV